MPVKKTSAKSGTASGGKKEKYYEAVGRRKTAIARVRVWLDAKTAKAEKITVNEKDLADYFKEKAQQDSVLNPFIKNGITAFAATIRVSGGGVKAQAEAARHGLSRALILANPESRSVLKTLKFLTRDPRRKERKKPGLKGARRAPQWSKR